MSSENLIRLFPLFRGHWTSPVIKTYVVWVTRSGWWNFCRAYQNTQTAESYQSSHLSEGCGKGRPRSRSFTRHASAMLPTGWGLSMQWTPGVTSVSGQSCHPCPPSLPVGEANPQAGLVPHQPQLLVTWQNLRGRAELKLFAVIYSFPQCKL